jgi:hypothetical protein
MDSLDKLHDLFTLAAEHAAKIFRETGEVLAMWHAVDGNDENILIATPWFSPEEKRATAEVLREMFRKQRVKRYAFMCEAWTLMARSREAAISVAGRIHLHPDRREILAITAEDRDGHSLMGHYYILRPEHGSPTLSPLQMCHMDEKSVGALMGLLR